MPKTFLLKKNVAAKSFWKTFMTSQRSAEKTAQCDYHELCQKANSPTYPI
jgi:hypothetical protein